MRRRCESRVKVTHLCLQQTAELDLSVGQVEGHLITADIQIGAHEVASPYALVFQSAHHTPCKNTISQMRQQKETFFIGWLASDFTTTAYFTLPFQMNSLLYDPCK